MIVISQKVEANNDCQREFGYSGYMAKTKAASH